MRMRVRLRWTRLRLRRAFNGCGAAAAGFSQRHCCGLQVRRGVGAARSGQARAPPRAVRRRGPRPRRLGGAHRMPNRPSLWAALNKAFSRSYRVPAWLRAAVSLNGWPCAALALCRTSGPGLQVKTSEYRTINDDEIVPAKVCRESPPACRSVPQHRNRRICGRHRCRWLHRARGKAHGGTFQRTRCDTGVARVDGAVLPLTAAAAARPARARRRAAAHGAPAAARGTQGRAA
jgi:hypothetical protein